MRAFDSQYDDWAVGDLVVWEDDKEAEPMKITEIDAYERVHWSEGDEEDHLTRATNLLRVKEQ
jgi:hypothetical protein